MSTFSTNNNTPLEPLYPSQTTCPLRIVIVGCGLGGLAAAFCLSEAGHDITLLESASQIGEVGAGIQISPNLSRLLIRWGLTEQLKELAVVPESICFRRWNTGDQVGLTKWGEGMVKRYGAPYYHIHRADLHKLLFDLTASKIHLRTNSRVVSVDASTPTVTLASGEVIYADLIIGADGVKSTLREVVVGGPDKAVSTGDAAYRAIVSTEPMLQDPLLRGLVELPQMTGWMGPGRHLMGYCIRAKKEYNMVMLHPDETEGSSSSESWTDEIGGEQIQQSFLGWEPRIQKLLALVPSTLNWKLMDRLPLPTWIHQDGKVVLLGDACHPMLPYRAQGAAMAVEDAAVLGNIFSHLSDRSQLLPFLQAYEKLRLPRASATQAQSRLNQHIFHLEDGPEQIARDESMQMALRMAERGEIVDTNGNANQWADETKNDVQFHYDPDAEVEKWWNEEGKDVAAEARVSIPLARL